MNLFLQARLTTLLVACCFVYPLIANAGMTPEEVARAQKYLNGAINGDPIAQFNLGLCFERGIGVAMNHAEAVKWYRKAAEQNNPDGQASLAGCYYFGIGVMKDEVESYAYYSLASRNMEKARQPLSLLSRQLPPDKLKQAKDRTKRLLGELEAKNAGTGNLYTANKTKAEQGDAKAQGKLGYCFYYGEGVGKDYAQAVFWLRKAAEQGEPFAQNNIGYCYQNGEGVTQDLVQAVFWYIKSANQENEIAQSRLAYCYFKGLGVAKDYEQAIFWYRKAAEQGEPYAQFTLGECYEKGEGVEQDKVEAYAYYNVILSNESAAKTSYPDAAREKLSYIEKTMSRGWLKDEVAAGQKRTKELLKVIEAKGRY